MKPALSRSTAGVGMVADARSATRFGATRYTGASTRL
jgi:hypothetical protein